MRAEHLVRLRVRTPFAARELFAFLALRAVPGVEEGDETRYRRTLRLPGGPALVDVSAPEAAAGVVECRVRAAVERDVPVAVAAVRRLVDAAADPVPIAARLVADGVVGPLAARTPGLRSPGHVDGHELAFRAVLGQQVSVGAARTLAERLVTRHGVALERPVGGLTHMFPTAQALAGADPDSLPMPATRGRALVGLAAALAARALALEPGADVAETTARLQELPGIGPWTASYIAMRALGDPDAFLPSDAGVRHALTRLGRRSDPAAAARLARRWAPYRSYALHHLWAFCGDGYRLLDARGAPYLSPAPGTLGGHRRSRIYGRLDCPGAARAIARGGYVRWRVFFADEQTARAAGYRPCAVCLPERYARWKAGAAPPL